MIDAVNWVLFATYYMFSSSHHRHKPSDSLMTRHFLILTACLLFLVGCSRSQADAEEVPVSDVALVEAVPTDSLTETERQVQALLAEEGVHVVHFWAPWCHNSMSEFRERVWNQIIEDNEDVTFIFVTVFNDGDLDAWVLEENNIPERVHTFAQPDHGAVTRRSNRRKTFLGLPLTWTPTTWIFNREGKLASAVNFGEVRPALMQSLLDNAQANWSRH